VNDSSGFFAPFENCPARLDERHPRFLRAPTAEEFYADSFAHAWGSDRHLHASGTFSYLLNETEIPAFVEACEYIRETLPERGWLDRYLVCTWLIRTHRIHVNHIGDNVAGIEFTYARRISREHRGSSMLISPRQFTPYPTWGMGLHIREDRVVNVLPQSMYSLPNGDVLSFALFAFPTTPEKLHPDVHRDELEEKQWQRDKISYDVRGMGEPFNEGLAPHGRWSPPMPVAYDSLGRPLWDVNDSPYRRENVVVFYPPKVAVAKAMERIALAGRIIRG
jgi:hypothetical protein